MKKLFLISVFAICSGTVFAQEQSKTSNTPQRPEQNESVSPAPQRVRPARQELTADEQAARGIQQEATQPVAPAVTGKKPQTSGDAMQRDDQPAPVTTKPAAPATKAPVVKKEQPSQQRDDQR